MYHGYLTYDEQKATEAAFNNEPLNPNWSFHAREVYVSIRKVLDAKQKELAHVSY